MEQRDGREFERSAAGQSHSRLAHIFRAQFTSFGSWALPESGEIGKFVYGIPTAAGDVPITGSADYSGEIRGLTMDQAPVFGPILLSFNFGAGTLSGEMTP